MRVDQHEQAIWSCQYQASLSSCGDYVLDARQEPQGSLRSSPLTSVRLDDSVFDGRRLASQYHENEMNHNSLVAPGPHAVAVWRRSRVPCMRCPAQQTPPTCLQDPEYLCQSETTTWKYQTTALFYDLLPILMHIRTSNVVKLHYERTSQSGWCRPAAPSAQVTQAEALSTAPGRPQGGSTKLDLGRRFLESKGKVCRHGPLSTLPRLWILTPLAPLALVSQQRRINASAWVLAVPGSRRHQLSASAAPGNHDICP